MSKRLLIVYHTQIGNTGRMAEPLIARHGVTDEDIGRCEELGEAMAAGVAPGIF